MEERHMGPSGPPPGAVPGSRLIFRFMDSVTTERLARMENSAH